MSSYVVMGVDPGTAVTGYGLVSDGPSGLKPLDYGVLRTGSDIPLAERLCHLAAAFERVMDRHQPQAVAVEEVFFSKNAGSALAVGHARGVILLCAARRGLPLFEYPPLQVKMAVTGYGRADKAQVQDMVARILGMQKRPRPVDAADALAVAICCSGSRGFRQRLEESGGQIR